MSTHRCCVMAARSPATTPVLVVMRHAFEGPDEVRRSSSAIHLSGLMPSGMTIELETRNPLLPGEDTTSSPGTSLPGLNCANSVHVPAYSSTSQPAGTSNL